MIVKSGASSDQWTVDATSKAGRVTLYDTTGVALGTKATYRAAIAAPLTVAASTAPFFAIQGSATKTIRVHRIGISRIIIAAVAYATVEVGKYSTAISAGTPVALTQVPLDSSSAAGTANLVNVYTAAPTAGTLLGIIANWSTLVQATVAAAAGVTDDFIFDFRAGSETTAIVLRGVAQGLALNFDAAAANQIGGLWVEWTEE